MSTSEVLEGSTANSTEQLHALDNSEDLYMPTSGRKRLMKKSRKVNYDDEDNQEYNNQQEEHTSSIVQESGRENKKKDGDLLEEELDNVKITSEADENESEHKRKHRKRKDKKSKILDTTDDDDGAFFIVEEEEEENQEKKSEKKQRKRRSSKKNKDKVISEEEISTREIEDGNEEKEDGNKPRKRRLSKKNKDKVTSDEEVLTREIKDEHEEKEEEGEKEDKKKSLKKFLIRKNRQVDYSDEDNVMAETQEDNEEKEEFKTTPNEDSSRKSKKDKLMELANKSKQNKSNKEVLDEIKNDVYTYTIEEEEEETEEARERRYELLEGPKKKERSARKPKKSQSIKARNKFFDNFDINDIHGDIDDLPTQTEEFIKGDVQFAKLEKKKDIGNLMSNIQKYKTDKIRAPVKKNVPVVIENQAPATPDATLPQLNTPTTLSHSASVPPSTLQTQGSMEILPSPSLELKSEPSKTETNASTSRGRYESQKSNDFRSLLSHSKSGISVNDDYLPEVEVTIPHKRVGSQTIADNTLFVNFLARKGSFVDSNSIKAQFGNGARKNDLKHLAGSLEEKRRQKKSENLTLEMIQSRFQVTDLRELEKKNNKKDQKKAEDEPEKIDPEQKEDKESNHNLVEMNEKGEDDEFTFKGDLYKETEDKNTNSQTNKAELDIFEIVRLEEGEESVEEADEAEEYDNEEEEEEAENEDDALLKGTNYKDDDEEEEEETSNSVKQAANEEKYSLAEFEDVNLYGDKDEATYKEADRTEDDNRKSYKKLKKIGDKIMEAELRKERERAERIERAERRKEAAKKLDGYMDVEAEVGSDDEVNDDRVKAINRKEEGEDEEGLDEDLDGFIDNTLDDQTEGFGNVINAFIKDTKKDELECFKKVMRREYMNRKRKFDQLEIDVDQDERNLKKLKRMEEIIAELDAYENKYLNIGDTNATKLQQEEVDEFDEEIEMKRFEVQKAGNHYKKLLRNQNTSRTKPKDSFMTDDQDMVNLFNKNLKDNNKILVEIKKKTTTTTITQAKPKTLLLRQNSVSKNSILSTKNNPKDINLFYNRANKDILNDFGFGEERSAGFHNIENIDINNNRSSINTKVDYDKDHKPQVAGSQNCVSSLSKLFMNKSKELTSKSPNKLFIFKYRDKK